MAARLEIEIVDRSPPAQQGQGGEQGTSPAASGWTPPAPAYERPDAGTPMPDWAGTRLNSPIPEQRREQQERDAINRELAGVPRPPGMEEKNPFDLGYDSRNPFAGVATGAAAVGNFAAGTSNVVANLAQNNVGGAVAQVAEGFASLAGKIPVVGPALEAVATASGQVVKGFSDMVTAFVDRGKQISGYNAPLAQASAEAEVRDILFDIREASELGTEYARLTTASSEAWTAIKEALLPIKKFLLEVLASFLETVLPYLTRIPTAVNETGKSLASLLELQQDVYSGRPYQGLMNFLKRFQGQMDRLVDNTEKDKDGTDTIANMLKVLGSGKGEAGFFPLNGQGGGAGLNIPILGGA